VALQVKQIGKAMAPTQAKAPQNKKEYNSSHKQNNSSIQIIQPTRCNSFTSLLPDVYV